MNIILQLMQEWADYLDQLRGGEELEANAAALYGFGKPRAFVG